MKTISLMFCLVLGALFTTQSLSVQRSLIYSESPILGIWEGQSGQDKLRVTLWREPRFVAGGDSIFDVIMGTHRYTRAGVIVEQSPSLPDHKYVLFSAYKIDPELRMVYWDLTKRKAAHVNIRLSKGSTDELYWKLVDDMENDLLFRRVPLSPGFTVPTEMVLKRIK